MRRALLIFLGLLLTVVLSAQTMTISVVGARGGAYDVPWALFAQQYPDVRVVHSDVDMKTGETITMDALLAAGKDPDIYVDFVGRAAKYRVPQWAQALEIDESQYKPGTLDMYKTGNKLLGIPMAVPGQALVIRIDVLERFRIDVPGDDWTINEFRSMARIVKSVGYWPTGLFAANPSGDYLYVNWFGAFGAKFYNSDYSRCTLDDARGLAAFRWLKELVDNEWVPPGPAMLTDDDYCATWQTGQIVAGPLRPSWVPSYMNPAVQSGILDKPMELQFVPFPHDPTLTAGSPTIGAGAAVIVHKTADRTKLRVLTDAAELLTGYYMQTISVSTEGFSPRADVTGMTSTPGQDVVNRIANRFGWLDVGYAQPWYYEVRAALPEILGRMYNGRITPEQGSVSLSRQSIV